jgi:dTDP-4-amino-4,6-dideoxygalactose transaminase
MLGALIARLRGSLSPVFYDTLRRFGIRNFGRRLGVFPRPLANEIGAVSDVLHDSKWNMAYGRGLVHERLEAAFADYVGSPHAVAVNTGGMALQMSMRALGLKPGHEVLLQADTCSATAFAVMNAGCTPIFSDIAPETLMLSSAASDLAGSATKAVIATHMWGNPEDMETIGRTAAERNLTVIEDACLSLGAMSGGQMAGTSGRVGVFSFGSLKPIQSGEGGMIVTADEALARELRSLRHWGDRTLDYGTRDTTQLAWNGRMSEIVAAVVREQLRGYPHHLAGLRAAAADFADFLNGLDGLTLVLGKAASVQDCAFSQIVLRLDPARLGCSKAQLKAALAADGIVTRDANFEPIPSLSFFRNDTWREWILKGDMDRIAANYRMDFPNLREVYQATGLGIPNVHLFSPSRLRNLKNVIAKNLRGSRRTP